MNENELLVTELNENGTVETEVVEVDNEENGKVSAAGVAVGILVAGCAVKGAIDLGKSAWKFGKEQASKIKAKRAAKKAESEEDIDDFDDVDAKIIDFNEEEE